MKYGVRTAEGTISQSSYQKPAFESRLAVNRKRTIMSANTHVAALVPCNLDTSDIVSEKRRRHLLKYVDSHTIED